MESSLQTKSNVKRKFPPVCRVSFHTCFAGDFDIFRTPRPPRHPGNNFGIFAGLPGSPDLSSKTRSGDDFWPIVGPPLYVDPHGLKFWHPKRHSTRVLPRILRILTFGKPILRPPRCHSTRILPRILATQSSKNKAFRPPGCHSTRVLPRILRSVAFRRHGLRLPGCHSARVLPGILTTPRVQKEWLEAPRVSFRTCFTEDFDNSKLSEPPRCHSARVLPRILTSPGGQQAWLEAPRVSFRTCFAEDFDIRGVQKAWLEAPGVSFHTCFTEDFDKGMA